MTKTYDPMPVIHQLYFVDGAIEALYKITPVLTSRGVENMCNRWTLTKAADEEFRRVVGQWYRDNYDDIHELVELGESWHQLGIWFICSVQGEGTGLWDIHTGKTENREQLKELGDKLHKAAQSTFDNEAFNLYIRSGKHCAFQHKLTNKGE